MDYNELVNNPARAAERIIHLEQALRELANQVEISGAVDDHGHPLKNLQALVDARALLDNES